MAISRDSGVKILIINPFGIGDVLFTTPIIRAIKDIYPDSFIGYWCNERVEGILKSNPRIDKIFALSRGDIKKIFRTSALKGISAWLKLFLAVKKEKFDIALDYSLDARYELFCRFCGISRRIGHDYKKRGRFLTEKAGLSGYTDKHIVEYYADLLKFIAKEPRTYGLELFVSQTARAAAGRIFADYGIHNQDLIVGIAPGAGASWGQDAGIKRWPASSFAGLANRVVMDLGARILILGDMSERPIAEEMKEKMRSAAVDLTGQTSLEELAAIIERLDLLITNDGGPLHMAVALNKKTVSFFGPVDPKVYGPYPPDDKRHIVLSRNLSCSPCYRNFHLGRCVGNRECLEKIKPEEALEAVRTLLKEREKNEDKS